MCLGQLELCILCNVYPVYVNWYVASACSWLLQTIVYYLIVHSIWPEKHFTNAAISKIVLYFCIVKYVLSNTEQMNILIDLTYVWSMLGFRCHNDFVLFFSLAETFLTFIQEVPVMIKLTPSTVTLGRPYIVFFPPDIFFSLNPKFPSRIYLEMSRVLAISFFLKLLHIWMVIKVKKVFPLLLWGI
jgi:hypothetical protein